MALPAIAAAISKKGAGAAKGATKGGEKEKPKPMSPEGITMLALAGVLEIINIIIGFLDFAFGIGIILGPIVNLVGTILIGGWLWMRFGKVPLKKALGPLVVNSIPLAKFLPWWLLSVGTSLNWKGGSKQEQPQEKNQQSTNTSPQPAKTPA